MDRKDLRTMKTGAICIGKHGKKIVNCQKLHFFCEL